MQFLIRGYSGAEFYPIADIEKMRHAWKDARGGEHPATILLKCGREIRVNDKEIDRIVRQSTPIIPAVPGFELLTLSYMPAEEDGGPWVHREPVLGWRDATYGGLEPVVVDYDFTEMTDSHAILKPDGRVSAGESWHDNEQEWIDYMKGMRDAEHARKQTAALAQEQGATSGS
jgi:hypothetical protein